MSGQDKQPQYDDPDQYGRSRRLRSIYDARDQVRETRALIKSPELQISTSEGRRWLYSRVDAYLTELEPKLEEHHQRNFGSDEPNQAATPYYQGVPLGKVVIEPPPSLLAMLEDDTVRVIGNQTLEPKSIPFEGLKSFIEASPPFFGEWTLNVDQRHRAPDPVTKTNAVEMPMEVSTTAFRYANLFADDIGLDIDLKEGLPSDHVQY